MADAGGTRPRSVAQGGTADGRARAPDPQLTAALDARRGRGGDDPESQGARSSFPLAGAGERTARRAGYTSVAAGERSQRPPAAAGAATDRPRAARRRRPGGGAPVGESAGAVASATGSTGADGAAARDPQALRAAATAEWQRGVVAARQPDLASRRLAVSRFEAALLLDPGLAAAHAGLAHTLVLEGLSVAGGGEEMERARRAAEAALALDERLPDAHAALAFARLFADRAPAVARAAAERALALDPTHVGGRRALAWVLAVEGRFLEALAQLPLARTSTEVDPRGGVGRRAILYLAGRSLEARRQLSEVVRREPLFRRAHAALAALHLRDRRLGAAAFELEMLDALAAGATRDDDRVRQRAAGSWAMPEASEAAPAARGARREGAAHSPWRSLRRTARSGADLRPVRRPRACHRRAGAGARPARERGGAGPDRSRFRRAAPGGRLPRAARARRHSGARATVGSCAPAAAGGRTSALGAAAPVRA